ASLEVSKQIRVSSPWADQTVWNATGLPSASKTPNPPGEPNQGAMSTTPTFAGQSVLAVFSIRSRIGAVVTGVFWAQTRPSVKTAPGNASSAAASRARNLLLEEVIEIN